MVKNKVRSSQHGMHADLFPNGVNYIVSWVLREGSDRARTAEIPRRLPTLVCSTDLDFNVSSMVLGSVGKATDLIRRAEATPGHFEFCRKIGQGYARFEAGFEILETRCSRYSYARLGGRSTRGSTTVVIGFLQAEWEE